MTPAPSPLEQMVLITLIRWSERISRGLVSVESLKELRRDMAPAVREVFPRQCALVSETDLESSIDAVLHRGKGLKDWWRQLSPVSGVFLEFAEGEPTVPVDQLESWEGLLDHLDGDALVTAFLNAGRGLSDAETDVRNLTRWGVTVRAGDRSLKALWGRGLSDMHVHVGGVRFAHFAWLDMMDGQAEASAFRGISRHDSRRFEAAREAREALWGFPGIARRPSEDAPLKDDGEGWWRWNSRRLLGERILLASHWASSDLSAEAVRRLDQYLSTKSLFMAQARQPIATAPGLRVFGRYFRYTDRRPTMDADQSLAPRLAMRSYGDALVYLNECPHLSRVELRVGPARTAVEYGRLAKNFGSLMAAFNKRHPPGIDARLAIHFTRSRRSADGSARLSALSDMLIALDRNSAALRAALADKAMGAHTKLWFSRLDVAGWERDTPATFFAPYVRLARGDEEALFDLEALADDDPRVNEYRHWIGLRDRGAHRPSLAEPSLGLTIHAGEDFADPLDGLHQISAAMTAFQMRAGDGIGHGLAMTVDVQAFMRERAPYGRIRRGSHLNSLLWLAALIDESDSQGAFVGLAGKLRVEVEAIGRVIYGGWVSMDDLVWLEAVRRRPCSPENWGGDEALRRNLLQLDIQPEVRTRCDELISLPPMRLKLASAVSWAQREVLSDAIRRRVVVEMNPASNLRISGSGSLALSPAVEMLLQIEKGLLASINTDNPGSFLSRVENEYALLLAGCRAAGVEEGRIRDLLERARRIGLEETWWPQVPRPIIETGADDALAVSRF